MQVFRGPIDPENTMTEQAIQYPHDLYEQVSDQVKLGPQGQLLLHLNHAERMGNAQDSIRNRGSLVEPLFSVRELVIARLEGLSEG